MVVYTHIIEACKKGEHRAQQELYSALSPVLFAICRRYLKRTEDAEDALVEAFIKIFKNLKNFKGAGSFEGWAKRIAINESLMQLRKKQNFHLSIEYANTVPEDNVDVHDAMSYDELIMLLDELPTGYKTIFNLYVIEGFKHKEIAEKLDISINTSKSQLIHAKSKIRQLLKKKHNLKLG